MIFLLHCFCIGLALYHFIYKKKTDIYDIGPKLYATK